MTHGFNLQTLEALFPHLSTFRTADRAQSASSEVRLLVLDRDGDSFGLLLRFPAGCCATVRVDLTARTFRLLDTFESLDEANGSASLAVLAM